MARMDDLAEREIPEGRPLGSDSLLLTTESVQISSTQDPSIASSSSSLLLGADGQSATSEHPVSSTAGSEKDDVEAHPSSSSGVPLKEAASLKEEEAGGVKELLRSTTGSKQVMRAESLRKKLEAGDTVYSTENVGIHPSALASQRIRGRLRLVKHETLVYLSWDPYTAAEHSQGLEPQAKGQQYAIRAVSLTEMRSIRKVTPPLGWQYIIIVLNTGLAFPPLYFYDGGVRRFIAAVKEHTSLMKSHEDPNVYLVNDTDDPLMLHRSLSSIRLRKGGGFADLSGALDPKHRDEMPGSWRREDSSALGVTEPPKDVPMQVLQGFAGITKFARMAISSGMKHGERILGGQDAAERMPVRELPPQQQQQQQQQQQEGLKKGTSVSSAGAGAGGGGSGGLQKESPSELGQFELVDPLEEVLAATQKPSRDFGPPLKHEEWVSHLDEEGRVRDKSDLCTQIFRRGIEPELRREVWKFLLGYYPFDSTYAARRQLDEDKREEYAVYKLQWQSVTEAQARRFAKYRERVSRIEKDVVRTDRKLPQFVDDDSPSIETLRSILLTYSFYNFDLGYCQGMSDLLAPFLIIMEDEVETFWCFAQFMETMGRNFNRDQTGMHSQLLSVAKLMRLLDPPLLQYLESIDGANMFCCFRWLLILFKREFEFEDVMKLWERLWTCPLTRNFHLYMCCAILKRFRRKIMDEQMQFDALVRFVNELSCHMDLDDMLQSAEALCAWAGQRGEGCMPQLGEDDMVLIEGPESGRD